MRHFSWPRRLLRMLLLAKGQFRGSVALSCVNCLKSLDKVESAHTFQYVSAHASSQRSGDAQDIVERCEDNTSHTVFDDFLGCLKTLRNSNFQHEHVRRLIA